MADKLHTHLGEGNAGAPRGTQECVSAHNRCDAKEGDYPHPTFPLSHLNIDNDSLNFYHTTERIREHIDFKALIKTGFGL